MICNTLWRMRCRSGGDCTAGLGGALVRITWRPEKCRVTTD